MNEPEDMSPGVSDIIVSRPKSARHACPPSSIRMFAYIMPVRDKGWDWYSGTHAFEVSVDHPLLVHINQPLRDVLQL